jgi:urease accessory protein
VPSVADKGYVLQSEALLATLQNADSFFPGGGIAFSWGLETLITDRQVQRPEELAAFVAGQLEQRWAVCERPALVAAFRADGEMNRVGAIDRELEALTLAAELREGSRRAGAALLTVHERIGTAGAAGYRTAIRAGEALGHLPVVQGVVWRGGGMDEAATQAVSAHTFCVALLGAALRLGTIGHLQSQTFLLGLRGTIARLIAAPVPAVEDMYACTPATEIAAMRHEVQSGRLFAN